MLSDWIPSKLNTHAQCTFTYGRKRPAVRPVLSEEGATGADRRKDVVCGDDQQPQLQTTQCKPACFSRRSKKRSFTQLHLDAGQVDFACTACKVCGFVYAKGKEDDEKLHAAFHDTALHGFLFQGWQNERVVRVNSQQSRIILVIPEDPGRHLNKVEEVCSMLEDQLGLCKGWLLNGAWQVYLILLSNKRLVGCVVTEKITTANPIAASDEADSSVMHSCPAPALPCACMQPLTPMSAPPQGQHTGPTGPFAARNAVSCLSAPAKAATGVSAPVPVAAELQSNPSPKPSVPQQVPLQVMQPILAATPQPAKCMAAHRGSLQHGHKKETLLTRWLAASRCNAAAESSAAHSPAKPSTSSATGKRQEAADTSTPATNAACSQQLTDGADESCCSSTAHAAVESVSNSKLGQARLPDTPTVANQTEASVAAAAQPSLTGYLQHGKAGMLSLLHTPRSNSDNLDSTSPHQSSRLQRAVLVDKEKFVKASLGVKVMWVSSDHRRKGIASQLLDTVRCHCMPGSIVPRHQLAFSQPTWAGQCFAQRYTGSHHFLVYQ